MVYIVFWDFFFPNQPILRFSDVVACSHRFFSFTLYMSNLLFILCVYDVLSF